MPPKESLLPRGQTALDDRLAEARQTVKDIRRARRGAYAAMWTLMIVFGVLTYLAVVKHSKHSGGLTAAAVLAGCCWLAASYVIAAYVLNDDEGPGLSRASFIKAQMQLEKLIAKQRETLVGRVTGKLAIYSRYRESMPDLVLTYRTQAGRYRRTNNLCQSYVILASLAASAMTGIFGSSKDVRLVAVAVTLIVAATSSLTAFFRLRERGGQLQKTADLIEIEYRAVEFGLGEYDGLSQEDALRLFVQKVERMRTEHMTRQRQLDQPPDLRHIDQSSISLDFPAQG